MNHTELISEIKRLKEEKNAMILAHYYQIGEIQDIADIVGDSLALAQKAAQTDASILVICGVHFMGETAKILSPEKKVLVPDLNAGCSLADSCKAEDFEAFIKDAKEKSVKDFEEEVDFNDNILTLSTCYNTSSYRLVVHAKLI